MSAWKLVAHYCLPAPLIMTVLLVIPTPRVVRKGLLMFTKKVLFMKVVGHVQLVHFMLLVTGAALVATSFHTYRLSQELIDDKLTPNQRVGMLARKWREERNFWMALLTFLQWGLLYRFYVLLLDHMNLRERVHVLEAAASVTSGLSAPAPRPAAPSAPPLSVESTEVKKVK